MNYKPTTTKPTEKPRSEAEYQNVLWQIEARKAAMLVRNANKQKEQTEVNEGAARIREALNARKVSNV